ncbi:MULTISPECIES: hypothetical protein [Chryseobacterium]|jgi:hypothetical protein|uniref:hypothetical protein n=1 Tax=Chryseobacterium TaxID=59732 RepID=UPI001AE8F91C|nr:MULTISPECIES: hypothetical protein [Chryseobacterium]MBP1164567.1 hypothetical protein [Chryseobacterium sp. PvR013]MDR6461622.1 hypothetical protein [Chryseobacterium sediminis]
MKKFIPILSLMIGSVCLQNCIHREEDIDTHSTPNYEIKVKLMRRDSAKIPEQVNNPEKDPPVRDGDNWRPYQNN